MPGYAAQVSTLVSDVESRSRPGPSAGRGLVLAVVSTLPAATVLWGLSLPGFPMAAGGLLLINAVVLVLLWVRWGKQVVKPLHSRWWRTGWVLPVSGILLCGGLVAATSADDAPLHARWAASSAAFEAEVAVLGPPRPLAGAPDGPYFDGLAGSCPARIGWLTIGECLAVHEGYLFLQSENAVTDSSGIAYLPHGNDPERTGLHPDGLTALGGPWWAWTCYC